ncbi:MAG TPA: ABC transporter substrate-binding protein [Phycisphaerae bacterium]|nr:ABC transporter substrate-binding protein [Phycisphaerae bacterium]
MLTLIRRIATVTVCLLAVLLISQRLLTKDILPNRRFTLRVVHADPNNRQGRWEFVVNKFMVGRIGDRPASVQDALAKLRQAEGALTMTLVDDADSRSCKYSRDAEGRFSLDGRHVSEEAFERRVAQAAAPPPGWKPTRPVTVMDVLEANIPMPTRSKVSFPELAYKDAFPEANDEPEIVIAKFDEAPMLKYMRTGSLPAGLPPNKMVEWKGNWDQWSQHYPKDLPPVAERLPRNPAVVVGPDGIGQYGGIWRRCTTGFTDLGRKLGYESFTRHDPSGNLQPCLAYKWEVSPDNRVFTFYLRKGHRWSDGQPFGSRDILWVCNTQIGSAHWPSPPDWMQPTDGSLMLYEDDVSDWPKLAKRIVAQAEAPDPSVGKQIKALASKSLWGIILAVASGRSEDLDTIERITDGLNELLRKRGFYTPEAFSKIDPEAERRELEQLGASKLDTDQMGILLLMMERADLLGRIHKDPDDLEPIELGRMNLLLFRSAYRDLVLPPLKRRVKVEAVPDEHGDDSHIVRFTFRRPTSLFLEQTTTFMFYRGIFGIPFHKASKEHPAGTKLLAMTDFWSWESLLDRTASEAQSGESTPGGRLWERLGDPARQLIQSRKLDDASKQQIVDGLNAVMAKPGFYHPSAWPGFDAQAVKAKLLDGKGFSELARDSAKLDEYRDTLLVVDLLRRFAQDGAGSLSDEEHLVLNVAMFRAAYTDDTDDPPVSRTREVGLNIDAQRSPRKYTSWVRKMQDRGNYHEEYNPHQPVVQAWRVVTPKDMPEIMAVRNPYYYRVDAKGNQLPYIDAVRNTISNQKQVRVLKLISGNVDFQSREINFDEFTVLKQNEGKGHYEIRLWANDYCGEVTFWFLQAHKDPAIVKLHEDPNFRYAMSLALNRQEMIDIVFMGMGKPGQWAVPIGSPYYNEKQYTSHVEYDPAKANRLLDAMGLDKRARDGTRLLPDGEPLILDLNFVEEHPLAAARLAVKYWRDIGLNVQLKIRTGGMISRMCELGILDIGMHKEGGNFFGPLLPGPYYPSHPAECPWWSQWVSYMRSGGRQGRPAPERIKEIERMWRKLVAATNRKDKMEAWKAIAERNARDLPIIGVMTSPGKVIYVKRNFKNVPKLALAGWIAHEPGNCCPECFYFDSRSEGN